MSEENKPESEEPETRKFWIYKWRKQQVPFKIRMMKLLESFLKSIILLTFPIPFTAIGTTFWHKVCFDKGFCFDEKMEAIVTSMWSQLIALLYCLLVAAVFGTVWLKYNDIRIAIKKYDVDTFAVLRDERISPLVYTLITVLSFSIIAASMCLKYSNLNHGMIVVGSIIYLLSLVFFVVREIDDPFGGLFFIRYIPDELMNLDVRKYRAHNHQEAREKLMPHLSKFFLAHMSVATARVEVGD
jgi:hypothetical protein